MVAINQRIPNFLGGVSQQPDTIKFPGQLRVCDNAVPDVTFGLKKRPPGEFVKSLTNAHNNGYWYEIIRDGDEKYIVQIGSHRKWNHSTFYNIGDTVWNDNYKVYVCYDGGTSNGTGTGPAGTGSNIDDGTAGWSYDSGLSKWIQVWDLLTGNQKTLTNPVGDNLFSYIAGCTTRYPTQSIQDYMLIANPEQTVQAHEYTEAPINSGNYAFARMDTIAYNTEYVMYSGSTPPTPNTYYRVTALSVDMKDGSSLNGNSWTDSNKDGRYSGLGQFSFSDSSCEDVEGHVTVNGTSYIDSNTANYDGDGTSSSNFLGYTQNYKTKYTAQVVLKDGGLIKHTVESTALGKYEDISIEGIAYRVKVTAVEPVETYEGVSGIAFYRTPKNPDKGKISMVKILQKLYSSVNANLSNVTAEVIGSGLYLYGSAAPTVNFLGGAVNEAMNVIGNTAQDVSKLPSQCKHGYIAQVANSENVDSDNYYVKFLADNGTQGSGRWEECVRPNNFSTDNDPVRKGLDPGRMPHALVNNRDGTFTFKQLNKTTAHSDNNDNYWKYREVGDTITNPFPSFNGKNIQKIFFHRNRLGLVADEQVVMSRPGDYFNFFIVSALTTSDDNPIDITLSDIKPAYVNHVLEIQKGMMMFSDNGQFLLFSESDIFSPKTARLKKISSFECDSVLQPVDMGTSVMFTSSVSAYARAYEATILDDDVPPKIVEQTRVVPEFLPKRIDIACNSNAIGINTFARTGTSEIYHYKYFDTGDRRDQSAWYSWTIRGDLKHCFYTAGSFYTICTHPTYGGKTSPQDDGVDFILNRYEYIADATAARTYTLGSGSVGSPLATSRWFEACLDSMTIPTNIAYHTTSDGSAPYTSLTLPYTPIGTSEFYAVALDGNDQDGNPVAGQVIKANAIATNEAKFSNVNMVGWTVAVGYSYLSTIELPNYYFTVEPGKYDIDGDLRIAGMNFEMGVSGPMEFHITPQYADMASFIQYESGMKLDDSDFGKPPSSLMKTVRVPIQKKNEKYKLTIKIPDPFSTALISASWDGRYNPRRHARK